MRTRFTAALTAVCLLPAGLSAAPVEAEKGNADAAAFDVVHAEITRQEAGLLFNMRVAGRAGADKPTPVGKLAGSTAFSYVWPTDLDSAAAGFGADQGILAMAVTAHPDFDDTPLYDENGDGERGNDGNVWHSHWVVLVEGPDCGPDKLKVKDIPEGANPILPATWPGLPIYIDSPGYDPTFAGEAVEVVAPLPAGFAGTDMAFDGVTAGLRVNESVHAPLLCVADVFDIASGDLSLPGTLD